jgi:hypothetical protein
MKTPARLLAGLATACASILAAPVVHAQSTDGYHSIQVFPIVVDTASFTQRFSFDNPSNAALSIDVKYFPAEGTSQATPLDCGDVALTAGQVRSFASLRELCGGLASGSQFGFLYLVETESRSAPFAAYSRVANPQGNGFSVEAFPASTLGALDSKVIGVRRLAAGPSHPAFQTNCFVGSINDVNATGIASKPTYVSVHDSAGNRLGAITQVPVTPGKLTRILDVFAFVGAPAGDHDNAWVKFTHDWKDAGGLLNFCTVQDNTSFGADFRIAKQAPIVEAWDSLATRDARVTQGVSTSYTNGYFRITPGGPRLNTHVMYFRHPDYVQCELIDPATGVRALPSLGLEMRLVANDGSTVLAGGNDQTGFGKIYLGDRKQQNGGYHARYSIDVETTGANAGLTQTNYELRCQSGSGHTLGDLVVDNVAEDLF